ncbi:hypothetical protein ACFV0T_41060 [Streptomyces sp. NPDC059582]|uniref:hypothetical protein n=1 Tax=Streptomyces sp. NPDC059582 TaxID=3346875 RepID=UPI0036B26BB5
MPNVEAAVEAEVDPARVARCPVTPELADGLIRLADTDPADHRRTAALLREAGWRSLDDALDDPAYDEPTPDIPECDLISPHGHFTYLDGYVSMPFAYQYLIGNELLEDDYWGALPGWTSEVGAWRDEFDTHTEAVVRLLRERLGPPEYDLSQAKYDARQVVWRRESGVVVVAQGREPISYHQFHHAEIYVGSSTDQEGYFPGGSEIRELVTS